MRVAQHARRLDASVEKVARLGQLSPLAPEPAEGRDEEQEELALAGGARDGQCAIGVGVALGVAVEIELHAGKPGRGFDVAGELVVGLGIDERGRLCPLALGSLGCPGEGIGEGELGKSRRDQGSVAEAPRCVDGALGPLVYGVVARAPDTVHGELDHQLDPVRRTLVRQAFQGAFELPTRVLLPS